MKVADMTPEQREHYRVQSRQYRETHKEQKKQYYAENFKHKWDKKKDVDGEVIEEKYFRLFGSPIDIHF
jgi:broad specificity polyphosphatase/5'/3'-nucleotidase SurE